MSKYKWIMESGSCSVENINTVVSRFVESDMYCLASYTDKYICIYGTETIDELISDSELLEFRCFNPDKELVLYRGCIGEEFTWRVTNDKDLNETDYIIRKHVIDINEEKSKIETGSIISTVGGKYKLPIKEERHIIVKSYIQYTSNGIAKIVDNRVCQFVE